MTNTNTHDTSIIHLFTRKFKVLMANVNGLHNSEKRNKIFNFFKTKKKDLALLQETHSTTISELTWQKEWKGLSFWNSDPTHQSAGVAILFH